MRPFMDSVAKIFIYVKTAFLGGFHSHILMDERTDEPTDGPSYGDATCLRVCIFVFRGVRTSPMEWRNPDEEVLTDDHLYSRTEGKEIAFLPPHLSSFFFSFAPLFLCPKG